MPKGGPKYVSPLGSMGKFATGTGSVTVDR